MRRGRGGEGRGRGKRKRKRKEEEGRGGEGRKREKEVQWIPCLMSCTTMDDGVGRRGDTANESNMYLPPSRIFKI